MRPRIFAALALVALGPASASAQAARGLDVDVLQAIRAGEEAHTALRPRDALDAFQDILEEHPGHYGALWRAAREAVSLGMLAGGDQARWYEDAEEYARRSVEANPEGVAGHEWLAIALGRSALDEGPRTRVRLSEEVRAVALRTLELDSLSAPGHHVLGEWHAEIRRLSGVTRWAAERLLGAETFGSASWDEARRHLERAVELDPRSLIHHLALARLHLDRERPEEARRHLREVLERPSMEPTDPLHKQRAQELLAELPPAEGG